MRDDHATTAATCAWVMWDDLATSVTTCTREMRDDPATSTATCARGNARNVLHNVRHIVPASSERSSHDVLVDVQ
ncbi:hypothetical protein F511_29259 [Dorcoceras hygrometricum]|uniref:Uncharacterized protein n=1 Tax=Dorcoceras hygrometricum TaxID=472368 RepID=A0A2Z7BUZ3_9LAMI|nr:hypothetical protein F511_29259 [Dorcoceras hygrometricum]